jgi:hypothetical protein
MSMEYLSDTHQKEQQRLWLLERAGRNDDKNMQSTAAQAYLSCQPSDGRNPSRLE